MERPAPTTCSSSPTRTCGAASGAATPRRAGPTVGRRTRTRSPQTHGPGRGSGPSRTTSPRAQPTLHSDRIEQRDLDGLTFYADRRCSTSPTTGTWRRQDDQLTRAATSPGTASSPPPRKDRAQQDKDPGDDRVADDFAADKSGQAVDIEFMDSVEELHRTCWGEHRRARGSSATSMKRFAGSARNGYVNSDVTEATEQQVLERFLGREGAFTMLRAEARSSGGAKRCGVVGSGTGRAGMPRPVA